MAKEHPILFSTAMVRATLDNRKTQTRRVIKPQPHYADGVWSYSSNRPDRLGSCWKNGFNLSRLTVTRELCPHGKIGDRLWVREGWWDLGSVENGKWVGRCSLHTVGPRYVADCSDPFAEGIGGVVQPIKCHWKESKLFHATWRKRPSIHMPKWACRLWLEITNIRVERVQNISEEDAIAEGLTEYFWPKDLPAEILARTQGKRHWNHVIMKRGRKVNVWDSAIKAFRELWDDMNAKRGSGWEINPWVWVIEFKKGS